MGTRSTSEASLRRSRVFVFLSERRMNELRVGSGLDGSIPTLWLASWRSIFAKWLLTR